MKQVMFKLSGAKVAAWVALSAVLFSFSGLGVDSYTIRMGDKLTIEQYVTLKSAVPTFALHQRDAGEALSIYYNHCGQIGTSRSITIKDEQNNVLKEWKYMDAERGHMMVCKVKDILAVAKEAGQGVQLVYASKEIPAGKVLANVTLDVQSVARAD